MNVESSPRQLLRNLIVPVLGLITAIVSSLKEYPRLAAFALIVVAIALISGYVPEVVRFFGTRFRAVRDQKALKEARLSLLHLAVRLGDFLGLEDGLPNPYMVLFRAGRRIDPQGGMKLIQQLQLPHPEVLSRQLNCTVQRTRDESLSPGEVLFCVNLFHGTLQLLDHWYMLPIFTNETSKLRGL